MKRVLLFMLAGALTVGLTGTANAQQSLGEIARENRKAKKPKAVKVYDNDNLPTSAAVSTVGIVNQPEKAEAKESSAKVSEQAAAKEGAKANETPDEARQNLEQQLKDEIARQKAKVDDIAHELDLLQREYRLRTALYYSDAGYRLRAPQAWAEEDLRYRNNIATKEQELAAAKDKLAELEEAARKAGLSSKSVE